jgi:putative ABC transport system permease protein
MRNLTVKGVWRDLVYAARSLARARAFTLVCVVSLGIGMVPVIAIPYVSRVTNIPPVHVNTEGMVELVTTSQGPHPATERWSYPDYVDLRDAGTGITLFAWAGAQSEVRLQGADGSKLPVSTGFVPADYFKTIGVTLARGAGFDQAMDSPLNAEPVVVLGHSFWQNRLSADADILGKTLTIDGVPHVVVGIAPDRFSGHLGLQGWALFIPLERHPRLRPGNDGDDNYRADRSREWLNIHGRLSPGVGLEQASAAVAAVTARLAKDYPSTNEFRAGIAAAYDPFGSLQRPQLRLLQLVGLTLTGMVLLVVSLNISGMMQVRSAMRERELSIRQAVGASRARLARHLLSEALVLACAGGALASLVLLNLPFALSRLSGQPIPPPFQEALKVDFSIVAIGFGLCLITSLVFGWLPATRFSRPVIISSLKDDAGGGFRVGRVHRVTAALQVAIAVPLIVMSGQSLDRFRATATSNLGFAADLLYAAPLKLDGMTIQDASFQIRRLRDTLARASGVASVTVADGLPLDFRYRNMNVALEAGANSAPVFLPVHVTRVGDGYLETLRIPVTRGRGFTAEDRVGSEPVTVVSEALADRLAPDGDVIGKRMLFGADAKTQQTLTIVGITSDFPTSQMSTTREQILLPLAQYPGVGWDTVTVDDDEGSSPHIMLIARSAAGEDPQKLTNALDTMARELDPELAPASIVTGVWLREKSVNDFLTQSMVAAGAGGVILILAALGIYGVVGLMVATRTREIAVRVALGSSRRRVLGMIVFDVVKLVTPGCVVGVMLTIFLNRLNAENMGISLSNVEPLAYVAGAVIAVCVAVLASLAPARRAASIEPMVAMRSL